MHLAQFINELNDLLPVMTPYSKPIELQLSDECYVVTSHAPDTCGYPYVRRNGSKVRLSRFVATFWYRNLRPGECVLHSCDNPSCINPIHLSIGTHQENMADKKNKLRNTKGEKHPKAKLTTAQVEYIRSMPTDRGTRLQLAGEFDMAENSIYYIQSKRRRIYE